MARKKLPDNETHEQAAVRKAIESIANNATRNEKVSWDRKMDNMVKLISKLRPIEDKIMDLMAQKLPLFDDISALRTEMVKECIHPSSHLVFKVDDDMGEYVECKFCDRRFTTLDRDNGST